MFQSNFVIIGVLLVCGATAQFIAIPTGGQHIEDARTIARNFGKNIPIARAFADSVAKQQNTLEHFPGSQSIQTIPYFTINTQQPTFIQRKIPIPLIPVISPIPTLVAPSQTKPSIPIPLAKTVDKDTEDKLLELEQSKNAQYSFSSSVLDTIHDQEILRSETRDGLSLKGVYSYSDGYFRRTVHYAADENGYKVVKEEIEPIGDGPRFNIKGKADVSSSLSGSYSITADDVKHIKDIKDATKTQF